MGCFVDVGGIAYCECDIFSFLLSFTFGGLSFDFLCLDPLHLLLLVARPLLGLTLISGVVLLLCAAGSEAGVMTSQTTFVSSQ